MGQKFALGALRNRKRGENMRLVHSGRALRRYCSTGALDSAQRCTTRKIPPNAIADCAPGANFRRTPPSAVHQPHNIAVPKATDCTKRRLSPTAPPCPMPILRQTALFYRYVSSRRCRAALYFRSRRMRSVLARKLRPSYGVSKSTKSRNVRSSASTVQTSSIISGYW